MVALGTLYFAAYLVSGFISAGIAYWVYLTQRARGWRTFVLILGIGVLWATSGAVNIASQNPAIMELMVRLELAFGLIEATLWLVFASQYVGSDLHRSEFVQGLLVAVVLSFAVLLATDPIHHLLWTDIEIYRQPFTYASSARGPLYFLTLGIIYTYVAISYHLLIKFLLVTRSGTSIRLSLLVVGVSFIVGLNALSIANLVPVTHFDHAGLGMVPFNFAAVLAVFKLDFLDIEPVARNRLVETLTDAVVVLDATHRVADFNRAATVLWPTITNHVGDRLAETAPSLAEQLTLPEDESVITEEVTLQTGSDDSYRHYSVLVSPIVGNTDSDQPSGYGILLRDITELEEYRRELERQNDQLDRFASAVSHDLRNPLTVANGHAEILAADLDGVEDTGELDAADTREHVAKITTAHDRISAIIDDLLTLAREGTGTSDAKPCSFGAIAREAWSTVDGDGSLELVNDGTIQADESRLRSIFENLFRNSLEHAGPDPTVTVGLTEDGFFVADDGPGIPADRRDRVFEYGHTDSEEGTGLGLSIVETMAESHGWDVTVTDSETGGARFEFSNAFTEPEDESAWEWAAEKTS